MIKVILASHGTISIGIKSALQILCGNTENIISIAGYLNDDFDLNDEIEAIFRLKDKGDTLIVLTDILGGSINNEFMRKLETEKFYLISGMNLGLALEIFMIEENENIEENLIDIINRSKESITLCNNLIQEKIKDDNF
ncbi:MAG: PTS sugar transporter subunit IIA [Sarcina sp.]